MVYGTVTMPIAHVHYITSVFVVVFTNVSKELISVTAVEATIKVHACTIVLTR
jgi:hypothetical protein